MGAFGMADSDRTPGLRGFDTVRVQKDVILAKLKDNRAAHRALFETALEGWHNLVIQKLQEQLKLARKNNRYQPRWNLPMPQDHTSDYDQAIELLEFSLDEELELTSHEFAQYIRDDWGWKTDFINMSDTYAAAATR